MTIYAIIFYLLSVLILVTTGIAITRRNLIHAVIYLIFSFFGSAMLFYLFGAPFPAVLEVIIYAGAIMVLFLFVVIMMRSDSGRGRLFPLGQWLPAVIFGMGYAIVGAGIVISEPNSRMMLTTAQALPAELGKFVFQNFWLSIEIVSLLLLVVLVGVLLIGRRPKNHSDASILEDG